FSWAVATPRFPLPAPARCGIPVCRKAALMPAAGPVQVAAVEFACAAVLSGVALLLPAGPGRRRIPGRVPRRFSVAFAEWAVASASVGAEVAGVDAVVSSVCFERRKSAEADGRYESSARGGCNEGFKS